VRVSFRLIDLRALRTKLARLFLHAFCERLGVIADAVFLGVIAYVLGDFHRAEMRTAHRAEMRVFGGIFRQGFVVEFLRFFGIEAEVELILPAEFETCFRQRVVARLRTRMTLGRSVIEVGSVQFDSVRKFPYCTMIQTCIRNSHMPVIHELATLTSKGQVTLPKSIRQALEVDTGSKLAFELHEGKVVVSRAEVEHEDPAIGAFLDLLTTEIQGGMHVRSLPDALAKAMTRHLRCAPDLSDGIDGDVAL